MKREKIDQIDQVLDGIVKDRLSEGEYKDYKTALKALVGEVLEAPLAGSRWYNTGRATPGDKQI
jgi:hypothetical protein